MFALFEEAGKFQAGRVLAEADSSSQIELESGKRVKVKAANVLLKFEKPAPAELIRQAQAVAQGIELELAWEFAPDEEFGFADLARDYFSEQASLEQQAGALFRLFEAPHYFRRAGKGRFKKAPVGILQQALVAIEKKKQVQQQIAAWAAELGAGVCPPAIREQLYKILFKPDKNAPEYKAVVDASRATHLAPLDLLQKAGAIDSAYQFHWKRFLFENFPKGTAFGPLQAPAIRETCRSRPHAWRRLRVGAGRGPAVGCSRGGQHDPAAQRPVVDGIEGCRRFDDGAQGVETGLARAFRAVSPAIAQQRASTCAESSASSATPQ